MEMLRRLTPLLLLQLLSAVSRSAQDKLPAGGCREGGVVVAEGSLVPQEDPCHVCHCHRGQIQCFWKSCASPPQLCEVMQLENRCNPSLYVCPIPASVADAPIRSASSLLVEASQPAPQTPPTRGRGRSRSRTRSSRIRSSRVRSSRLTSSRLRSPNSAAAPASVAAAKRARLSNRRRRPTVKPASTEQTVTRTQVRAPQTVTQTEVKSHQTVTRSRVRSPRPSRRRVQPRPGMKIRLGPPVLPLVQPVEGFLPPPTDSSVIADSAVAASVLSGSTYFNEELSVPQNFTMPQGRGASATRPPQQLLSDERRNKPFRFGPSRPKTTSEQDTEVPKASEVQSVTEPPQTTTTTAATTTPATTTAATTAAAATAATEAPRAAGRGRDFRQTSRRRGSSRRRTPSRSPAPRRVSSRRVVSPPRSASTRRSRLADRRAQAAQRAAAARDTSPASSTTSAPVTTTAPTVLAATTAPAAPSTRSASRRFRSRSRAKPRHETVPAMTFDYDLEEDINPTDFMFPEFGRRLRRSVPEEVFDAEAVWKLEEEWSARQRRRRRSLLPGDENHVHGAAAVKSCSILGVKYELGEVIGVASDNCLECRCAAQAMFCSPKCCFFSLEERVLREGRQRGPDQDPPRPHPLHAYIKQ